MNSLDKIGMDVNWGIKKMDKRYGSIPIVSVTILVLCFVGTASATTWTVNGSGGADFTVIQEAINNASVGDTIIVHSGVYYEKVVVNKSVTLKGNGQPVVDAGGEGDAIRLTADGITLVGFNATNSGSSWSGFGITVTSNNNTITGNNVSSDNTGIRLYISSNNNNITGNNVSSDYAGIYLYGSSNNTITGNSVSNNNLYGIRLYFSSNNTITGNNVSNNDGGIGLSSSSNNIITGNNVSNNDAGISLYDSSNNNTITGNNVSNNNRGGVRRPWGSIDLSSSSNNTITGNNVSNNNRGGIRLYDSSNNNTITGNVFVNDGLSVYFSYQNIVEDNTVNGKPLVYLEDVSDYKVEDAGQVILLNCDNITVKNLDLSNTYVGIELWKTENSKISNNTVCNNRYACIKLDASSSNNTITGNNVSNNGWVGIDLSSSSNNTITGNNVSNNDAGISLYDSSNNNTITGNNVSNNGWVGIDLSSSSNNTITGNNVSNNNHGGIRIDASSNNKIYFNNFINNTDNVYSSKSTNIWNSPLEITYTYGGNAYTHYVGNYWGNYGGTDAEGDGIGDTHYSIDSEEDESDDYPLMQPFENYNITTSHE
jgi:parallel beta-helix repeat protein